MPKLLRIASLLTATLAMAGSACVTDVIVDEGIGAAVKVGLDDDFALAAQRHGVPVDVLKAVSYVETRWQHIASDGEHEGQAGAWGVMALGGARLRDGAGLVGVGEASVQEDVGHNIDSAAALLGKLGRDFGLGGADLLDWEPAIGEFSAIVDDDEARQHYVDQVYQLLRDGHAEEAEGGELIASIEAHRDLPSRATGTIARAAGPDYAEAVWRASPNIGSRGGADVTTIIIHTCEGGYAGCYATLRGRSSGVSAHYVVNEQGSEVTQLVRESDRAWHIAASYKCSLNDGFDCGKNGTSVNTFSVGIEHAGFASQASFPDGQIEASAKLTCDIARDNGVPIDRNHILGHGQLQPNNRTDPGRNWPWSDYIDRVRQHCNEPTEGGGGGDPGGGDPAPAGPGLVVDSNNANNDAAASRAELTGWTSASATPGYYGTGYAFASAGAGTAKFWFYAASAGTRTVSAWWTAGTNRTTAATFVAYDGNRVERGRVSKNQQTSGSQWVTLGTWTFSAGWNRIELIAPSTSKVAIADAIRVQ